MRFLIVTGMSGAGKTQAIHCLEDMGYYCVDNMPPVLLSKFAELCYQSQGKLDKVALVIDLRGGYLFHQLFAELDNLKKGGYSYEILFLDADTEALIKRYKETRRAHPLAPEGRITEGIEKEHALLSDIKERANYVIDTTKMPTAMLKQNMIRIFGGESEQKGIPISILSFGFKYGIPLDADLVFDVRFLPNPFYIDELKHRTGLEGPVRDYVFGYEQTTQFCNKLGDMMEFLVPYYIEEGKNNLVIAIGCTGGKHRSVALAEWLGGFLKENDEIVNVSHRDIEREA